MKTIRRTSDLSLRAGLLLLPLLASLATAEDLAPTQEQGPTAAAVLSLLEREHYRDLDVDDRFSERLLDRYLDALDPSRSSFLAADVTEFEKEYGHELDDTLPRGDVRPAFVIFNRFRARLTEQVHFQEDLLESLESVSFEVPETLAVDRSEAPWLADEAAAHDLWRRRFKNDVLVQRIDGQSDDEIQTALGRRYHNQLHRIEQMESRDVFNLFMNAVTGVFGPHTSYFPPREAENFDMMMSLSFQGIGAVLGLDGEYVSVTRLLPGGPAEASGKLKPADRILAVGEGQDGELVDVVGTRLDEVVGLIRGPAGTQVRLLLQAADAPEGTTREVVLTRDEVQLEEQAASSSVVELERDGQPLRIGVIDLPAFYVDFAAARAGDPNYRSSTRDVARILDELQEQGVDGVVMDLRGNGGGSLTEARDLSGLFLGRGPIVQVRDAHGRVQVLVSEKPAAYDGPLVVLVDRLSASASEIFAAAIQDRERGLLVGSRTFGKGTVQSLVPLKSGELKLTQAKFYRVSGGSTQERGVQPDIEFPSEIDPHEIGESALPGALPWDRIDSVVEPASGWLVEAREKLARAHRQRVSADPAFRYHVERGRALAEMRQRAEISLQESVRREEVRRDEARLLEIANRWRQARGLDPVEDLDDLGEDPEGKPDSYAREAAEILADLRSLPRYVVR